MCDDNIFSLIHYEKNKLTYDDKKYNIEYIIDNIKETIVLVLENDIYTSSSFVSDKKYYRYFVDEKHNFEKTSYVCWLVNEYLSNLVNTQISLVLLSNLSSQTKYIKFNYNYNQIIDMLADTNITHIIFGNKFNQSVDNLPWTMEYLGFGYEFNQTLDNLPGSMKKIIFSANSKFNHLLDCLPSCLEYLLLPVNYKCQIDNLPNLLKYLELDSSYPNSLNNLPKSLEKFIFYHSFITMGGNIYLSNKSNIIKVPKVSCYYDKNTKIDICYVEKIFVSLPENLKHLDLTYSYKLNFLSDYLNYSMENLNCHIKKKMIKNLQILDNLPTNLEVLKYPSNYNLIMVERIPQNIIRLFLSNKFNKSVDKLLNPNFGTSKPRPPTKITHLVFGDEFNQPVNYLPLTLKNIFFGSSFNKSIDNLPDSIEVLVLGTNFNKCVQNFPTNLIEITFGEEFNQSINGLKLKVKKIIFTKYDTCEKYCKIIYSEEDNMKKDYYYKFNYDKKISKIPPNAKLFLPDMRKINYIKSNEKFYPMFNEYMEKELVEYY
jgi:hypothetical protein